MLNRVPPRAAITADMTEALAQVDSKLAKARLGNRVGFASAMSLGLTIMDTDPSGKGATEVDARTIKPKVKNFDKKQRQTGIPGFNFFGAPSSKSEFTSF